MIIEAAMPLPTLTTRRLMAIVALVALDLAAGAAVLAHDSIPTIGLMGLVNVVPMGLALNLGLLRLPGARGPDRAFWLGFLACGGLALAVFAWAALTPPAWGISTTGAPNQVRRGSKMWALWNSYLVLSADGLSTLGVPIRWTRPQLDRAGIRLVTIVGLIAFLPQLAIACLGGLGSRWIHRRSPRVPDPPGPA